MTETKPAPKYIYELTDPNGKLRYVEARNKEQAIAHVFHPAIRTLSDRDAVTIARNPNIQVETAGEKLASLELPLATADGAAGDGQPTTEIVGEAVAQSDPGPVAGTPSTDTTPPADEPQKKRGLFGRSVA